jgi:antitoxin MazE
VRAIVKKRGNNASVRIPAGIMEESRLSLNDPIDIREESGRIVIEPVRATECELAQLLAGITPESLHAEVDFGAAAGKELL